MIVDLINKTLETNAVGLDSYIEWLKNLLKITGLSFSSVLLFFFIFWISINLLLSILAEIIPMIKGLILIMEYIFLPGSLMRMVWRVFSLKKLNYKTEQIVSFGWGWSRYGIKVDKPFKTVREGLIFFWSPLMNIPVIIGWIIPGMLLFQWLDTLIDGDIFYWIWLYVLVSLLLFGVPSIMDIFAPLQITVVKTPEFYLFIMFYVIIAPITLIFWGWGITAILTLIYAVIGFYEVEKISKNETKRLSQEFDSYFSKTSTKKIKSPPVVIITDEY